VTRGPHDTFRHELAEALAVALDKVRDTSAYRWPQQEDVPPITFALLPVVLRYVDAQVAAERERARELVADLSGKLAELAWLHEPSPEGWCEECRQSDCDTRHILDGDKP
jgi:hypothetical protein